MKPNFTPWTFKNINKVITVVFILLVFQLVDFEAMTTPSPESFSKTAKSWMNLKRYVDETRLLSAAWRFFFFSKETLSPFAQLAKLVPEPSVRRRDFPVDQDDDRGPQHGFFLALSEEVLTVT